MPSTERLHRVTQVTQPSAFRPVTDLVRDWARRSPDAPAVIGVGTEVSYRALVSWADAVAGALPDAVGRPVAVRLGAGPALVATVLGVLDAGAELVCLASTDIGARGSGVLAEVDPCYLIIDSDDELSRMFGEQHPGRVVDLRALPPHPPRPRRAAEPGDGAYHTFTSGTTGTPKGIPQDHASLSQFVSWFAETFGFGPGVRVAQWSAPSYDAGLVEICATLVSGAAVCPVEEASRANPETLLDWMQRQRISVLQTVPSFARQLLRIVAETDGADRLSELRTILLAGEVLSGELANTVRRLLPHVRLANLYGPSEVILATWFEITGAVSGVTPIGRAIPGRSVMVLDEADRPCPTGVAGQVVIQSRYLTAGYSGSAASEREAFRRPAGVSTPPDPRLRFFRTGDLAIRRADGVLEFVRRQDCQVKFNGVRLELGDLEAVLTSQDSIRECAVVAVTGPDGLVTRLLGYIVPQPAAVPDLSDGAKAEWRAALRRHFGRAVPPLTLHIRNHLPRTVGGKVDRRLLASERTESYGPETSGTGHTHQRRDSR